jgi:hypothetical protein
VQKATYFAKGQTIVIDNEQMTVVGVNLLYNVIGVIRGVNGTTAVAHNLGASVTNRPPCFDAFTLAHLVNNGAPSNPNIDGPYFTCP